MTRPRILAMFPALFLAAFAASCATTTSGAPSRIGQLRHVVLFQFKDSATKEQVQAIEDAFRALPGRIPEIVDFEWGTDMSVESLADGFTHCFLVTFADELGRAVYLPHPAHKEFVAQLQPSLEKVLVVDYVGSR